MIFDIRLPQFGRDKLAFRGKSARTGAHGTAVYCRYNLHFIRISFKKSPTLITL